jgi:hypothetical protein
MAAKKMKKPKMPASELFRRVESTVEKGTEIKKRVKKIEGLPRSAGAQRHVWKGATAAKRATVALARVKRP